MDKPVVVITGAAIRIGACIARTFHAEGFSVAISYRSSQTEAMALIDELNAARPNTAKAWTMEMTSPESVQNFADTVLAHFGRVDVLVNNASSFYPTAYGESSEAQWDDLVGSNLRGAYFLTQRLSAALKEQRGAVVNLVDTHADRPLPKHPIYSIAKAGLKAMTKSLAIELAPQVRANGVAPGAILWPPSLEDDSDPGVIAGREAMLKGIPLAKLGSTQDIADAVYFLACEASYLTGHTLKVDGGRSLS